MRSEKCDPIEVIPLKYKPTVVNLLLKLQPHPGAYPIALLLGSNSLSPPCAKSYERW